MPVSPAGPFSVADLRSTIKHVEQINKTVKYDTAARLERPRCRPGNRLVPECEGALRSLQGDGGAPGGSGGPALVRGGGQSWGRRPGSRADTLKAGDVAALLQSPQTAWVLPPPLSPSPLRAPQQMSACPSPLLPQGVGCLKRGHAHPQRNPLRVRAVAWSQGGCLLGWWSPAEGSHSLTAGTRARAHAHQGERRPSLPFLPGLQGRWRQGFLLPEPWWTVTAGAPERQGPQCQPHAVLAVHSLHFSAPQ